MLMFNEVFEADNMSEMWQYIYNVMTSSVGEITESRDGDVMSEIIDATVILKNPTDNISSNCLRNMSMKYAVGELLWYMSGNKNLSAIQLYTRAWDRMSDDGKTVNSNYGWCIQEKYGFNQLDYVEKLLREDPNTRQAVIHIKNPSEEKSKDVPCTVCLQFFIRQEQLYDPKELSIPKLYMVTYMRSNDLWMGLPYDIFQFTCLQIMLAMRLNVGLGTYTHHAGSLHLYKRDYDKIQKKLEEQYG